MSNILIKTSGKRVLYFFSQKGLCVKDLIKVNSNPKVIFNASVGDFDVIEMNNGEIGIICQDNEGSIVFLRESEGGYLKSTLLKNKSKSVYDKHFSLHRHNDWISALYVIDYDGKKILSHQIVDQENITPDAVDELADNVICSFTDSAGNLVLLYNKQGCVGYKVYSWAKKEWSSYISLCSGEIKAAETDRDGNVYIIYTYDGKNYCLFLKNNNLNFSIVKKKSIGDGFLDCVMFFEDNALWIVSENKNKLSGIKYSADLVELNGPLHFGNDVYKRKYRIKTNEFRYKISECYGYETNNIPKLILYKNLYDTEIIKPLKRIIESGEEISEFAGVAFKKDNYEQIEINKVKIKISDLQKRLSRLENLVNNKLI